MTPATRRARLPWISLTALWAANSAPLLGVIFFDWRVPEIVFIFWFENVVVGCFTLQRMRLAERPQNPPGKDPNEDIDGFKLHYGMFTFLHGALILAVFLTGGRDAEGVLGEAEPRWPRISCVLGMPALVLGHWVSHAVNYVGRREYRLVSIDDLILQPYPRLLALHGVILLGGVMVSATGQPLVLVALLVVIKATLDSVLHVREHGRMEARRLAAPESPG